MAEYADQNYSITFNRNTIAPRLSMGLDYLAVCDDCLFKLSKARGWATRIT